MAPRRAGMDRALGPYAYPDHYTVVRVYADRRPREHKSFPFGPGTQTIARAKAQAYVDQFNDLAKLAMGVSLEEALAAYETKIRKKLEPGTVRTNLIRLRNFFPPDVQQTAVSVIDRPYCGQLFGEMASRPDARPGWEGRLPSADTVLNTLSVARYFFDFCVGEKWARSNPLDGFRPEDVGERNPGGKGKKQLNFDHLALWEAKAYELAEAGDEGAAAGLIALKLELRATKIVTRQAKHVDLGGAVLRVPREGAQNRTKRAPELIMVEDERLWPVLASLKEGKPADGWLFPGDRTRKTGHRDRSWVAQQIRRVCQLAGVPEDTHAHGMRGAGASLDHVDGRTLSAVQERLAHRHGSGVTEGSYLTAEAIHRSRQRKLMQVIKGDKKA